MKDIEKAITSTAIISRYRSFLELLELDNRCSDAKQHC